MNQKQKNSNGIKILVSIEIHLNEAESEPTKRAEIQQLVEKGYGMLKKGLGIYGLVEKIFERLGN